MGEWQIDERSSVGLGRNKEEGHRPIGVASVHAQAVMHNCTIVQVINKITFTFQKKYRKIRLRPPFGKDLSMNLSHTNSIHPSSRHKIEA